MDRHDIDTRPRTLIAVGLVFAAVITGMVLALLNLADNGPNYPALFNNSQLPAQVSIHGVPAAPVAAGATLRAQPGTTWDIPPGRQCTWHPGKAGTPRLVTDTHIPVTQFVTIEVC